MKASEKSGGQKKAKTGAAKGLQELFEHDLKDIYWAEQAIIKSMPKLVKNATSEELIEALNNHMKQTEGQIKRLEQVFNLVGLPLESIKCEAMEGLIKEAEEKLEETEVGMVRDAAIIASAQKIEHYEIATYGTLSSYAHTLDEMDAYDLLEETLDEEKDTDSLLSEIAESSINIEAMGGDEE
jgi:ferritin-like metal-binding protein YciE